MAGVAGERALSVRSLTDCARCQSFCLAHGEPLLRACAASGGVEYGLSMAEILRAYLAGYHDRGHRRDDAAYGRDS